MIEHPVLHRLSQFGIHLGLERMRSFLAWLGDPHLAVPCIHVGGTNGKFSVCRMIQSMLAAEGYRVGMTISPHLQAVNERISVDGEDISDDQLNALLAELDEARQAWARAESPDLPADRALTYFEMVTAAAFLHLARSGVDVNVIEVGLGGRLDATNVIDGVVTAITSVGLDHMDKLGPDVASIAAEKAGILKAGRPAVVGPLPPPAMRVVRTFAQERGATLYEPEVSYRVKGRKDSFAWSCGAVQLRDLAIPVLGDHQLENAGVALTVVHLLPAHLAVSERAIRQGLANVTIPGRLEWRRPNLIVDSAHNADGAARLADFLRQLPKDRPRYLLLGMSSDKDARAVASALRPVVDRVYTTHCRHPRARSAGELAAQIVAFDVPVLPYGSIEEALPALLETDALIIVAGSVFLAGAVRDLTA